MKNVRIIERPKENLYSTWNNGIKNSKGDVITFWNVDDTRLPEAVMEGLEKIESGTEIVYFPFIYKRYIKIFNISILIKSQTIKPIKYNREKFSCEMHCGPFFMVKRNIFEKIGGFDITFKIAGDFDWLTRAAKKDIKFSLGEKIAGIFTNNGTTLSGSKNKLQAEENNRVTKI